MAQSARRVVVTGLGLVTPLGCSVPSVWNRLISGECGIVSLKGRIHEPTGQSFEGLASQVAALVPRDPSIIPDAFDPSRFLSKSVLNN